MKIIMTENYTAMCRAAANLLSAQIIMKPDCVLGLATGSTPLGIYSQLIDWYKKGDLDFSRVRTVNLDEYCGIGPGDRHSYAYYMRENFFRHIDIQKENTHLPDGTAANTEVECLRYDRLIKDLGGIDMQLLGIGHNGHVGFNEPGDCFMKNTFCVRLSEDTIKANSRFFSAGEKMPEKALTVGLSTIMQAKKIVLAVSGGSKSEILYQVLSGPVTPKIPGSILQLQADVTLVADEDALAVTLRNDPALIAD
jgi:glucosamine-6-phosphate deaminase